MALSPSLLIRSATITRRAMQMRKMEFRTIRDRRHHFGDFWWRARGDRSGCGLRLLGACRADRKHGRRAPRSSACSSGRLDAESRFSAIARHRRIFRTRVRRRFADQLRFPAISTTSSSAGSRVPEALAFYSLAYSLLLLPVQLTTTAVGGVLFPLLARLAMTVHHCASSWHVLPALSLPCHCPLWHGWQQQHPSSLRSSSDRSGTQPFPSHRYSPSRAPCKRSTNL